MAVAVARILLMEMATNHVGQAKVAAAIGIEARSLRAKLSADRGVSDNDLERAAGVVEQHAWELMALASKMRGMIDERA